MLFKYDIIDRNRKVQFYSDMIEIPSKISNNKRNNKDVKDLIIDIAWSIDETKIGNVHMHLFIYCKVDWMTGKYSVDKRIYEDKVIKLNKFIVGIVRKCSSPVNRLLVNIVDEKVHMCNYITDSEDYDARNDNRKWLVYLSKRIDSFRNYLFRVTKYFSRTTLK